MDTRIRYLDIARGIGIFLVVLGHSVVTPLRGEHVGYQSLYDGIYLFHMAFFFFLSGFLTELLQSNNKEQVRIGKDVLMKKAQQFLLPYLFYSILGYGILGAVSGRSIGQGILEILTTENHLFHHLWFLYTMFIVQIVSSLFRERCSVGLLVTAAILHCCFSAISGLPFIVLYIVRYLFFFQAGRLWKKGQEKRKRFSIWLNVICFFILEVLYICIFSSLANLTGFLHVIERFICSLVICGGGVSGSLLLLDISKSMDAAGKGGFWHFLGVNSMEIYVLHMPFLVPGAGTILWKLGVNSIAILVICVGLGIGIPLLLAKGIHRSDMLSLLMFGRKIKREKA